MTPVLSFWDSLGKLHRPGWTKSQNDVYRIKYKGITCHHFFRVWYVGCPWHLYDFRDYEELVGKSPFVLFICIQAIREGVRKSTKGRALTSSGSIKPGNVDPTVFAERTLNAIIPHQSDSQFCVLNAFANIMGMDTVVRDYMIQDISPMANLISKIYPSFFTKKGFVYLEWKE